MSYVRGGLFHGDNTGSNPVGDAKLNQLFAIPFQNSAGPSWSDKRKCARWAAPPQSVVVKRYGNNATRRGFFASRQDMRPVDCAGPILTCLETYIIRS